MAGESNDDSILIIIPIIFQEHGYAGCAKNQERVFFATKRV